jgi:hypothetical protein
VGQPRENGQRAILATLHNTEDRNYVLQNAPTKFKGKLYQGNKVIVIDDVCEETRRRRKRLLPRMMEIQNST